MSGRKDILCLTEEKRRGNVPWKLSFTVCQQCERITILAEFFQYYLTLELRKRASDYVWTPKYTTHTRASKHLDTAVQFRWEGGSQMFKTLDIGVQIKSDAVTQISKL